MSHNLSLAVPALGALLFLAALAQVVYVPWLAARWKRGGCLWLLLVLVIDGGWFGMGWLWGIGAIFAGEAGFVWIVGNLLALSPTVALLMFGPAPEARRDRRVRSRSRSFARRRR